MGPEGHWDPGFAALWVPPPSPLGTEPLMLSLSSASHNPLIEDPQESVTFLLPKGKKLELELFMTLQLIPT